MNLQELYTEETNKKPTEIISGFLCFTDDYVEWLETKLKSYENDSNRN